jgi:hypothetical protein
MNVPSARSCSPWCTTAPCSSICFPLYNNSICTALHSKPICTTMRSPRHRPPASLCRPWMLHWKCPWGCCACCTCSPLSLPNDCNSRVNPYCFLSVSTSGPSTKRFVPTLKRARSHGTSCLPICNLYPCTLHSRPFPWDPIHAGSAITINSRSVHRSSSHISCCECSLHESRSFDSTSTRLPNDEFTMIQPVQGAAKCRTLLAQLLFPPSRRLDIHHHVPRHRARYLLVYRTVRLLLLLLLLLPVLCMEWSIDIDRLPRANSANRSWLDAIPVLPLRRQGDLLLRQLPLLLPPLHTPRGQRSPCRNTLNPRYSLDCRGRTRTRRHPRRHRSDHYHCTLLPLYLFRHLHC